MMMQGPSSHSLPQQQQYQRQQRRRRPSMQRSDSRLWYSSTPLTESISLQRRPSSLMILTALVSFVLYQLILSSPSSSSLYFSSLILSDDDDGNTNRTTRVATSSNTSQEPDHRHNVTVTAVAVRTSSRVNTDGLSDHAKAHDDGINILPTPSGQQRFRRRLPWPVRVMRQYQEWHAHDVLLREYYDHDGSSSSRRLDRKYALMYYWCPDRAGNILHNMYNTLAWAMIQNRTVLWAYDTSWPHANAVDDCQAVLRRAPWIPSWDEWAVRLGLSLEQDVVSIPLDAARAAYDEQHRVVLYPQITDIQHHQSKMIYHNTWRDDPSRSVRYLIELPHEYQRHIAAQLFAEGVDFAYGMFFRACFTIVVENNTNNLTRSSDTHQPQLVHTTTNSNRNDSNRFNIMIHSRHPVIGDDGSYVPHELACLEAILSSWWEHRHDQQQQQQESQVAPSNMTALKEEECHVYLVSDRPTTIQVITTALQTNPSLQQYKCQVHTANHTLTVVAGTATARNNNTTLTTRSPSTSIEHGPWAGIGFIQDIEFVASSVQPYYDAVIGDPRRSSFMLLNELLTYDRAMYRLRNNEKITNAFDSSSSDNEEDGDDLAICNLPEKKASGYDYGLGTPTFRHPTKQPPLAPVTIVDQYIRTHAAVAATATVDDPDREGRFAVIRFPLPSSCRSTLDVDSGSNVLRQHHYRFLNDILLAVLTNRTIVIETDQHNITTRCNDTPSNTTTFQSTTLLSLKSWLRYHDYDWPPQWNGVAPTLLSAADTFDNDEGSPQAQNQSIHNTSSTAAAEHSRMIGFGGPNIVISNGAKAHNYAPFAMFPPLPGKMRSSQDWLHIIRRLNATVNTGVVDALYSLGSDFMYGMLFDKAFSLEGRAANDDGCDNQDVTTFITSDLVDPSIFSIALVIDDPHTDLSRELQCLDRMTENATEKTCRIYAVVAHQNTNSTATTKLQDLLSKLSKRCSIDQIIPDSYYGLSQVSSNARSAFVGNLTRLVDQLLYDRIEYLRRLDNRRFGRDPPMFSNVIRCDL